MAGENTDFITQYLANRIFGDDLVDFLCKVSLPVNTENHHLTYVLIMFMDL